MRPVLKHWRNSFLPPPSPHPYQMRKKKKLMAHDDKLGPALTVHTVPTGLAPGQAWPGARATITNTATLAKSGWGGARRACEGASLRCSGDEPFRAKMAFGGRQQLPDLDPEPRPPSPTPAPFCKHGPQGSSSSVPVCPAAAARAELLQGGGSPPDAQGPSWLSAPCTEPSKQSGKKTSRHLIKRLLEDRT